MNELRLLCGFLLTIVTTAGSAQTVDMNDPRRAVGFDDDVRVDAKLLQETVSTGAPIGVNCVIQNRTNAAIAVSRDFTASYDAASRTVTLSVGSEVPNGGIMPRMLVIPSGEQKALSGGSVFPFVGGGGPLATTPRFVQVKVNLLRDLTPFRAVLELSASGKRAITLSDVLFDKWLESNDTIVLNSVPVHYDANRRSALMADASHAGMEARADSFARP